MMRKTALAALAIALVLGLAAPVPAAETAHIHFLVVAPQPAQGMAPLQAMTGFRAGLVKLAGGFTEWGPTSGASRQNKEGMRQNNFSFIVAADRDLTRELAALIKKFFPASQPFVLHWTGTASIPLGK